MRKRMKLIMVVAAVSSLLPSSGALELAPTMITLERDHPIATLRLANDGITAKTYELTGFSWLQPDGNDQLSNAPALIITPPVASLAPGEETLVRIGLASASTHGDGEETYRIRVRDITPASPNAANALRIRMEFLLPVIMPANAPQAKLRLADARELDGALCVRLRNEGNAYQKIVGIGGHNASAEMISIQQYILPASEATICSEALMGVPHDRITAELAPTYASNAQTLYLVAGNASVPHQTDD